MVPAPATFHHSPATLNLFDIPGPCYDFWQAGNLFFCCFQLASNGNEEEVEKLLSTGREPRSPEEKFCHPLCSCDRCEQLHSR